MRVVIFCVLVTLSVAERVDFYRPCDPNNHNINYVDIAPCNVLMVEGQKACEFRLNTTIQLHVNFQAPTPISAAKPVVSGIVGAVGLEVPDVFRLPSDACSYMDPPCSGDSPLAARTDTTYTASIYIQPSYPQWRVIAKWEIRDQHDHQVMCFLVPVQLRA